MSHDEHHYAAVTTESDTTPLAATNTSNQKKPAPLAAKLIFCSVCCICCLIILAAIALSLTIGIINSIAPSGCSDIHLGVGDYTIQKGLLGRFSIFRSNETSDSNTLGMLKTRTLSIPWKIDLYTASGNASATASSGIFTLTHYLSVQHCSKGAIGEVSQQLFNFLFDKYDFKNTKGDIVATAAQQNLITYDFDVKNHAGESIAFIQKKFWTVWETWYLRIIKDDPDVEDSFYPFLVALISYTKEKSSKSK